MLEIEQPVISRRHLMQAAGFAAAAVLARHPRISAALEPATAPAQRKRAHRILTCNILFELPEQKGTPFDWIAGRRDVCLNLIRAQKADIVCMQEVGREQNQDFLSAFPDYVVFGYDDPYVDRHPRRFQNIKNVIMFSRQRYDIVTACQYWLTDTPLVPGSRAPGAGLPRHVTWVRLRDRQSGRQFRVLDTHWDLKKPLRMKDASIIAADTKSYAEDFPQILCGDFNSDADSDEHRVLYDVGWKDTYGEVHSSSTRPATHPAAAPATAVAIHRKPRRRIDYVYFRGAVRPVSAAIIRANALPHPASDHNFVSADVEM